MWLLTGIGFLLGLGLGVRIGSSRSVVASKGSDGIEMEYLPLAAQQVVFEEFSESRVDKQESFDTMYPLND